MGITNDIEKIIKEFDKNTDYAKMEINLGKILKEEHKKYILFPVDKPKEMICSYHCERSNLLRKEL